MDSTKLSCQHWMISSASANSHPAYCVRRCGNVLVSAWDLTFKAGICSSSSLICHKICSLIFRSCWEGVSSPEKVSFHFLAIFVC